jgi:hypothetical protein
MLARLVDAARGKKPGAPPPERLLRCAGLRTEDTILADQATGTPSTTVARVMQVRNGDFLRESHVAMSEAWWTSEAVRPTIGELREWIEDAIPMALRVRVWALGKQRPRSRTTAKLPGGDGLPLNAPIQWHRLCFEGPFWLFKIVTIPIVFVLIAMCAQALFRAISLLAFLPIPMMSKIVGALLEVLMGTLGQSHALENSPVRRNAIVRRVVTQLDWLSDRCSHVAVIAHSQGAEITRLAFQLKKRKQVRRWVTFGAGILPLTMLEYEKLEVARSGWFPTLMWFGSLFISMAVVAAPFTAMPGLGNISEAATIAACLSVAAAAVIAFLLLAWLWLAPILNALKPPVGAHFDGRRSILQVWRDYFASNDPVPGGSFLKEYENDFSNEKDWPGRTRPQEFEIFNTRFGLLDHTSYFANMEQFVAPVAIDLLKMAGMPPDSDRERRALMEASQRRDAYTWRHMVLRTLLFVAAIVVVVWFVFGPAQIISQYALVLGPYIRSEQDWSSVLVRLWSDGIVGKIVADILPLFAVLALYICARFLLHKSRNASEKILFHELALAYMQAKTATKNLPTAGAQQ